LAERLGPDALIRMLGLWLEQESLVRDAANRELAVEVAALRLARWPTVQRLEQLLTGDTKIPTPATGSPASGQSTPTTGGRDGPPPTAGGRLARTLWEDHPRLAGAVENARVDVEGSEVVLRFAGSAEPLARFLSSDTARSELTTACQAVFGPDVVVRIDGGEPMDQDLNASELLEKEARDDPQVQMARRVLGGEIVAVRPDRGHQ
jgi:hypothetical protein